MNAIGEKDDALLYLQCLLDEHPRPAGRKVVAEQLAAAVDRAYPFSSAYLANVAKERQPMSNKLAKAIYTLRRNKITEWKNAEK
jgi:hypothetical protein